MAAFRSVCVVAALIVSSGITQGKEKPWTEVKSPHFRVLTDGSVGDARRVANEFEQIRAVFAGQFPKMRLETGAPLLIFAPHDQYSMKSLAPSVWSKNASKLAGVFQQGWERHYAIVRLDQDAAGTQVVYHEYVHSLLHANLRYLPRWLDEGLAEYYGSTLFEQSKVYIGATPRRLIHLKFSQFIPLEKMLTINPYVEFHGDPERIDFYYGECWVIVHYFVFGPGMEKGKKLADFYTKLQLGKDQKKAFKETFGEYGPLEEELRKYVQGFSFGTFVIDPPARLDDKSFDSRVMSQAETDAAIGGYRIWSRDLSEAREITEAGLQEDANLGELHENKGFLEFAEGKGV